MQALAFYHAHLEKVSRSFSFCIIQLVSPAREWVALGYLLCRIADIIEDSHWSDKTLQYQLFEAFSLFLNSPPSEDVYRLWCRNFPEHIPKAEKNLLADLPLLLEDLQELPEEIKSSLINILSTMIQGMIYFLKHKGTKKTPLSLKTTNHYCFFVAGVIGAWLTEVFSYLIDSFKRTEGLVILSFHFGLFLQKINILKDQLIDEAAGRYYLASREQVRTSLVHHAQESLQYIKAIPIIPGRTYRLFCAWSLFIGLASLRWMDKSWQMKNECKISAKETRYLVHKIETIIDDNYALDCLFKRYIVLDL